MLLTFRSTVIIVHAYRLLQFYYWSLQLAVFKSMSENVCIVFISLLFTNMQSNVCMCVYMHVFTCVGAHTSGHMCVLHGWADLRLILEILLE